MRLIGSVDNEKQAFIFYSFLLQMNIHSTYEPHIDPASKKEEIRIWVYEEDSIPDAIQWLEEFKANPHDPRFSEIPLPFTPPQPPDLIAERRKEEQQKQPLNPLKSAMRVRQAQLRSSPLTACIVFLCIFLYLWDGYEKGLIKEKEGQIGLELAMTPLEQTLLFDYPAQNQQLDQLLAENPPPKTKTANSVKDLPPDLLHKIEEIQAQPSWKGAVNLLLKKMKGQPVELNVPWFTKIREGEIWRLFTPALMHGGFLHILFNMLWAWLLLKILEARLSKLKVLLLILIIGIVANVAQYLMSGPLFLGFSGIVVGLVGFIWMRQKIAPWEGYPLHPSTIYFVLIFVGAMFAIDLFGFAANAFGWTENIFQVANTAHIVGGLTGIVLGRVPFFSRGMA